MKSQAGVISPNKSLSVQTTEGTWSRFITWADKMDYYRILLISIMLLSQGCIFAPFAIWSMGAAVGFSDFQAIAILVGAYGVLVSNLAVMPMRYTLPIYFVGTATQLLIIAYNVITLI
ncbi:MAG: hypothetical protein NXI20_21350 [bacterium]|nr:hypothetical protein [bacterium]